MPGVAIFLAVLSCNFIGDGLRDQGITPPAVDQPELYRVRSCQAILAAGQDWRPALADWHTCRTTDHPTGGFKPFRPYVEGSRRRYASATTSDD